MELCFWLIPLYVESLDLFGTITGSKMLLSLSDSKKLGKQETSANSFISNWMWHHHLNLVLSFIWHIFQSVTLLCHLLTALTVFSWVFKVQGWAPHILSAISEILGAGHCPIVDATAASCYMMLGAAAHSKHSLQCTQRHSPHSRCSPLHLVTRRHSGNTAPAADGWDC